MAESLTTAVRVPTLARGLGIASLVVAAGAVAVDSERLMIIGLSVGALLGIAAGVAYWLAPKRTIVLLEVRGDQLEVRSRSDPLRSIGRVYGPVRRLPVAAIRTLVARLFYVYRMGSFVDLTLTRRDGTTERFFFPGELRDDVIEFFRRLEARWPELELVDDGYHTRVTWRRWWRRGG